VWIPITQDRLTIGLYIKLQYSWVSHPFPRNEFRIGSQRDIDLIRQHRLTKIVYDPDRSEDPSALDETAAQPAITPPAAVKSVEGKPVELPVPVTGSAAAVEPAVGVTAEPAVATEAVAAADVAAPGAPDTTSAPDSTVATDRTAATHAADAADPAARKAASLARAARQRTQLGSVSRDFLQDARDFTRASDLLNAGEPDGFKLIDSLVAKRVAAAAAQESAMLYCGGAFTGGTAATEAAESLSACVLALTVGRKLRLDASGQHDVALGAALCNIGLQRLSPAQRHESDTGATRPGSALRDYPATGAAMLAGLGSVPPAVIEMVAQHRECLDGSGFPRGLVGDAIRLDARLVGAVRVYTVLTSDYRQPRALSPAEAVRELFMQYRSRQGADVVESFLTTTTVYPPGTFVELSDDSLAFVLAVNPRQRLLPRVLVLDNPESPTEGNIIDLAELGDTSVRRALSPDHLPPIAASLAETARVRGLAIDSSVAAA
jgi:HD-GYP domain-containing protein (c-di-GMP phosphodiesterase class II)